MNTLEMLCELLCSHQSASVGTWRKPFPFRSERQFTGFLNNGLCGAIFFHRNSPQTRSSRTLLLDAGNRGELTFEKGSNVASKVAKVAPDLTAAWSC